MGLHYHFLRLTCQVKSPCPPPPGAFKHGSVLAHRPEGPVRARRPQAVTVECGPWHGRVAWETSSELPAPDSRPISSPSHPADHLLCCLCWEGGCHGTQVALVPSWSLLSGHATWGSLKGGCSWLSARRGIQDRPALALVSCKLSWGCLCPDSPGCFQVRKLYLG